MESFAEELKAIRREFGHKTARAFFEWLQERGVAFNYSYYMRLEAGGLPSEKVVQELASATGEKNRGDRLVLAYCRELFPGQTYLFSAPAMPRKDKKEEIVQEAKPAQKELSLRQVAAVASAESVYHLFLLFTLARRPVPLAEIAPWFTGKSLEAGIKVLLKAGILRETPEGLAAVSIEARFPAAYNQELKNAYARFDQWDETFGRQFDLEQVLNKMLLRRVSSRYVAIILKQLDALFDLVRSSDEIDKRHNDTVLQLKVMIRQGKPPG